MHKQKKKKKNNKQNPHVYVNIVFRVWVVGWVNLHSIHHISYVLQMKEGQTTRQIHSYNEAENINKNQETIVL